MSANNLKEVKKRPYWFVGASYGGVDDQTSRFIQDGIWDSGTQDKYLSEVRSIQVGDRIAIKSAYTQKHDLPFDGRGHTASVMAIKAIGTVKENLDDGRTLKVDWEAFEPPRKWYFYTYRATIWRVEPIRWLAQALIDFTFYGKEQDIDRFRNSPYWWERFGDHELDDNRFKWTVFYEAIADKLLIFRNRRAELIAGIHAIAEKVDCISILNDRDQENGPKKPLQDICPFTTMNRPDFYRQIIASEK